MRLIDRLHQAEDKDAFYASLTASELDLLCEQLAQAVWLDMKILAEMVSHARRVLNYRQN